MMKPDPIITADEYRQIVGLLFGNAGKKAVCDRLRISRPTHDKRLKEGVVSQAEAQKLHDQVCVSVTSLRARARALDRWTTSGKIVHQKRLTHMT